MTKLECLDPSVGDAVLDAARPTGAMSRDQLRHVEECASCRLSVERVRRLVSTYRDLAPTHAEIGAARLRYSGRAARRHGYGAARRWHLLPRAITVTLLLAVVASAAAQIAARRIERTNQARNAASASKRPHHHRGHAHHRPGEAPNPALPDDIIGGDDQAEIALAGDSIGGPAPAPAAVAAAPAVAPPGGERPAPAPIARESPPVTGVMSGVATAPMRPRKAARHAAGAPESAAPAAPREELTAASWQAVAAALRVNDRAQAERALDALAEETDLRTRDAARLARAQLWLSQGKVDRARADLQDLAATGVTSLIRQSARDALVSIP